MIARWFVAALLVGLAAAAANADGPPTRIFHIGIVSGSPRSHPANAAFEDRLRELGYVEGRNLTIEFIQDSDVGRLAAATAVLAGRGFDVMVIGPDAALKAAFTATAARSTPIVFRAVDYDPLAKGYIASLAHPGANLTGVVFEQPELIAKRLDLLTQAVPHIAHRSALRRDRGGPTRRGDEFRISPRHSAGGHRAAQFSPRLRAGLGRD